MERESEESPYADDVELIEEGMREGGTDGRTDRGRREGRTDIWR